MGREARRDVRDGVCFEGRIEERRRLIELDEDRREALQGARTLESAQVVDARRAGSEERVEIGAAEQLFELCLPAGHRVSEFARRQF